jgi:hypothetical protein
MDSSITLNGIFSAQRMLEQSARRIATPQSAPDYADELITVKQSEMAEKANYRLLSVERNLEDSLLDLFA